jgi:hypothetical protein
MKYLHIRIFSANPFKRGVSWQFMKGERVRRRNLFVVIGYVVMPEHVYLLPPGPQKQGTGGTQNLKHFS